MNDMPECSAWLNRKARKDHKCTSCGAVIEKGTTYTYISGIWNGEPESYKLCDNCAAIVSDFKKMDKSLGWDEGPTLCRGGVGAWLQDFMYRGWHGEEAAKDISDLFGVPLDYVRRVTGLKNS